MLGALSLSKRLRVPSGVEGLRALSLPAVSQTLSEVEWELVESVETAVKIKSVSSLPAEDPACPPLACAEASADRLGRRAQAGA
jgi:hypothetical protein